MEKKKFYITTPIYYPSDNLHIGHSYCTVATDTMARYKRLTGYDVLFLTGADEHGQKIEEKAKAAGVSPQQYVDKIVASFQSLWQLLNISNDRFIRTTDDYHVESVKKIFKALYDKGDIYKGAYKGKYCTPCESFWTESQLVDGKCPDCGRPVVDAEEEAYFFRLSKYAGKILALYDEHPEFLTPQSRVNEMKAFISQGLEDLCVSRTSFSWGVPVEFDPKHVVYVWVDALSNYITALGYGNGRYNDFQKYWPADVHFVGKEIVRFHSIIWPAMLMALDLPLPKRVYGHGWLLLDGGKMSKSKGNVVDPVFLCQRYGVDAIRFFLLRAFPFGSDGVFSNEALITTINSDLANDLGNLVSRTVSMVEKYFAGQLPVHRAAEPIDEELMSLVRGLPEAYAAQMEAFAFQNALGEIFRVVSRANKYIDETTPWILAKDEGKKSRLAAVMYNLLEAIRVCAILLAPFMPDSSEKMLDQIGAEAAERTWESAQKPCALRDDVAVKKGGTLFPRIDMAKELAEEGFPAIVGPDLASRNKIEVQNMAFKTVGVLNQAGVMTAVTTDHPVSLIQSLPLCAGLAVKSGLSLEEGYKAITIHPAIICGVDHRVGSLEVGKDADIAIFTGNPMEVFTRTLYTIIDGQVVYEAGREQERFSGRRDS